jgi:hypothetical protein
VYYYWQAMKLYFFFALTFCLLGCRSGSTVDCETITSVIPEEVPFDALTRVTIKEWVQQTYQIQASEVSIPDPADNWTPVADVSWRTSSGMYQGEVGDSSLINIRLSWNGDYGLKADDVVRCLGNPQSYLALYVPKQFEMLLFYPERGLVVGSGSDTLFNAPPSSVENTPVRYFLFVRPNDLEMVLSDAYPNNEGNLQFNLDNSHEWIDWSDLIVVQ